MTGARKGLVLLVACANRARSIDILRVVSDVNSESVGPPILARSFHELHEGEPGREGTVWTRPLTADERIDDFLAMLEDGVSVFLSCKDVALLHPLANAAGERGYTALTVDARHATALGYILRRVREMAAPAVARAPERASAETRMALTLAGSLTWVLEEARELLQEDFKSGAYNDRIGDEAADLLMVLAAWGTSARGRAALERWERKLAARGRIALPSQGGALRAIRAQLNVRAVHDRYK